MYTPRKQRRKRLMPPKSGGDYTQIWRVIDGAVLDAFKHHPEYISQGRMKAARESIVKRATGAMTAYLVRTKQGRSGFSPAAK